MYSQKTTNCWYKWIMIMFYQYYFQKQNHWSFSRWVVPQDLIRTIWFIALTFSIANSRWTFKLSVQPSRSLRNVYNNSFIGVILEIQLPKSKHIFDRIKSFRKIDTMHRQDALCKMRDWEFAQRCKIADIFFFLGGGGGGGVGDGELILS